MMSNPETPKDEIPESRPLATEGTHRFYHDAMRTQFEILIAGPQRKNAEAAAFTAFETIDRIENLLSSFLEGSDIWILNHQAGGEPLRADILTLRCLAAAERLCLATQGAFDITVGPLIDCYRAARAEGREPTPAELKAARDRTGIDQLELDRENFSARLRTEGARIDLGAIGKGFALDQAAETLKNAWQVERAMLHSGGSTVRVLKAPVGEKGWRVGVGSLGGGASERAVVLENMALSASGTFFQGKHIFDPRTGLTAEGGARRTWTFCATATDADALSTALMVLTPDEARKVLGQWEDVAGLLLMESQPKEMKLLPVGNPEILKRIGLHDLLTTPSAPKDGDA